MRKLFGVVLIVVSAMIGYNYFFGDATERAQSERIIGQVKDLGVSVGSLVQSEHAKIKEGKYDGVFEKLSSVYKTARKQVGKLDQGIMDQLDDLESRKTELEDEKAELDKQEAEGVSKDEIDKLKKELDRQLEQLLEDSDELMKSID